MPVTRPTGRALVIGSSACRSAPLNTLARLGFTCAEVDDPYGAMAELCRRPLVYRAVILSLASLYREELAIIFSIKRRWPHVDIWLTQTDGRHAAMADAMRLGADGLLSEDGLHRTAVATGAETMELPAAPVARAAPMSAVAPATGGLESHDESGGDESGGDDPILTAEELRALLTEIPMSMQDDEV